MFDVLRRVALVVVPIAALTVIVTGLLTSDPGGTDPGERAEAIARTVRCPFCDGESIAESTSSVAADYEVLIREWVDEGYSDEEIYDRFRARFGEGIVLDGGTSGWSLVLWVIPIAAVGAGVVAILGLRRKRIELRVEEPV